MDRYLIAAARYNLAPIICINKIDLAGEADDDPAELARTLAAYQQAGYRNRILATSAADRRRAGRCCVRRWPDAPRRLQACQVSANPHC